MTQPPVEDNSTDENQVQDMLLTYLLDGEKKRSKQRHKKGPGTALVWTFSNRKNAVGYIVVPTAYLAQRVPLSPALRTNTRNSGTKLSMSGMIKVMRRKWGSMGISDRRRSSGIRCCDSSQWRINLTWLSTILMITRWWFFRRSPR